MSLQLLVFDSHPVQYRVPVWQAIETELPGALHVVYASDCSIRGGHIDEGFGKSFAWDEPMLENYNSTVLNCEKGKPLSGWASLTGEGVGKQIELLQPKYILITGLNYRYDWVVLFEAKKRGIPVWLRCETQDYATERSKNKYLLRKLLYGIAYKFINTFFFIGELNKLHYLNHGVLLDKLVPARYSTVNRFEILSDEDKYNLREAQRHKIGVGDKTLVIGFSGKLIPKKNPKILFETLAFLPTTLCNKICIYFMGSGEMQMELEKLATVAKEQYGTQTYFAGFVNQTEMAAHYLAMDIMVLPSRRMGETWGLVANEGLQAGCSVVVSNCVGSHADFKNLQRFRVIEDNNAKDLADKILELSAYDREFNWAEKDLESYTIKAIAKALISCL